jgi:hypothetical protein
LRVLAAVVLCFAACAEAQVAYTRHELGVSGTYTRTSYFDPNLGGITGRYTLNFRPELALETSFTFYPPHLSPVAGQGGRSLSWFAGPKAGIRRNTWGLFGKAMPGFRHFTSVPDFRIESTSPLQVSSVTEGRTHFALELGGVLELYPTSKWIIRTDVTEVLTRFGDDMRPPIVIPTGIAVFGYTPGEIHPSISISAGIGYRLGRRQESAPKSTAAFQRSEAGIQYALSHIGYDQGFEMMDNSGLGAWGSYYLNRHVAIDAAATHFWSRTTIVAAQIGGSFWQVVAGPKIGITREKFGAYAKFRPGIVRFSNASNNEVAFISSGKFQPVTQFALDMGGVLEFYPKRHFVVRMDFSDVTIHYGARTATYVFGPPFHWPAYWQTTLQTSFGFGWRF